MIYYHSGGWHILLKIFKCTGSVFKKTLFVALPAAITAAFLFHWFPNGSLRFGDREQPGILLETQAWGGFSFLVGFLIVFRTSQAYNRFWEGCTSVYRMRTEWFDAISSVVVFTKHSSNPLEEVDKFKNLVIRLTSMLHAAALAELEAGENTEAAELWSHSYEIIDPVGVDSVSIATIKKSHMRTELLFTWINQVIVENIKTGILSIPPPILSRSFQEMANGMVAFHDAMRISYVPFPFPYAQACDCMLVIHWLLVPMVTSQWVANAFWAAVFTFMQVFMLWSLNLIAIEIDHPFGKDPNDIDGYRLQQELNSHLILLLSRSLERTPCLSSRCIIGAVDWDEAGEGPLVVDKKKSASPMKSSFGEILHMSSEKPHHPEGPGAEARRNIYKVSEIRGESLWGKTASLIFARFGRWGSSQSVSAPVSTQPSSNSPALSPESRLSKSLSGSVALAELRCQEAGVSSRQNSDRERLGLHEAQRPAERIASLSPEVCGNSAGTSGLLTIVSGCVEAHPPLTPSREEIANRFLQEAYTDIPVEPEFWETSRACRVCGQRLLSCQLKEGNAQPFSHHVCGKCLSSDSEIQLLACGHCKNYVCAACNADVSPKEATRPSYPFIA